MKNLLLLVILVSSCVLLTVACKKNSDTKPVPVDERTALLTAKPWHKMNEGLDTNLDGNVDVVSGRFLQSCYADDIATFQVGGILNWSEGASKCNPADQDTYNLSWHFTDNGIYMLDQDNKIFTLTDTYFTIYNASSSGSDSVYNMVQFEH
jgi:hypothetical protein